MQNIHTQNATEATLLGVPFALLNMNCADAKAPAACAIELVRQALEAGMPVVQFHCADGVVRQLELLDADSGGELVIQLDALAEEEIAFYAVALQQLLPLEEAPNIYGLLDADSQALINRPNHRTRFAGVNELRMALETGHADETIDPAMHICRRREIAATVLTILRRDPLRYPELSRIRAAALAFLGAIDRLIEARAA